MEIISDLAGYIESDPFGTPVATDLAIKANVQSDPARADELPIELTVDGTAGEAAQPRGGAVQTCGFEIYIDGVLLNNNLIDEEISVVRDYDEKLQSASFTLHLNTPIGPFGSGIGCNIPPTRKKTIDIYGVYKTTTGVHRIPLITGGIAHASSRRGSRGYFESYTCVDGGGRYDQKLVDAVFPPGHGLTRDRVLQKCAQEAGVVQFRLEQGKRMMKEFQLADSAFLDPCGELLDIENRRILWNDQDELSNPQVGRPRPGEPVRWQFDERDMIEAQECVVDLAADAITRVTASGTEQLSAEQCGDILITTTVNIKDVAAPATPAYIQEPGGTYSANPDHPIPDYTTPKTVELQVNTRIERCGTIIYQRRETYLFYNPECVRYVWDSVNDEWDHYSQDVYVTDDSDDDNPAFDGSKPRWGLFAVDEVWTAYLQVGYRGSEIGIPEIGWNPLYPLASFDELEFAQNQYGTELTQIDPTTGLLVGPYANIKLGTLSRSHRMALYRTAVKKRAIGSYPVTPFDEIEPFTGLTPVAVTGEKGGVDLTPSTAAVGFSSALNSSRGERLYLDEQILESFLANDRGELVGKNTRTWGIGARRGNDVGEYWFGPDYVSAESEESFREMRLESETYEAVGKTKHNIYRTATNVMENRPARAPSEFGVEGYLPAAEKLPQAEVDASLYDSEDEQLAIQAATTRVMTEPMTVEVIAEDLEACGHEVAQTVVEFTWAENKDELTFGAQALIDESAAADVSYTLAGANFFVREGDLVRSIYRPIDLFDVIRVKRVEWRGGGRRPILTSLSGKLYHG